MKPRASRWLASYAFSGMAVGAALALTSTLEHYLAGTVLPPLLAVCVVVALSCGLGPAIFAVLSGALGLKLFFLPPCDSVFSFTASSAVRLGLFVGLALPLAWLASSMRKARYDALVAHDRSLRAVRQRDDILAIVSHDLRGPLSTLLLEVELLVATRTREGRASAKDHQLLERLRRRGQSMNRLIGDLLDLSSIDAGGFVVDSHPMTVSRLVELALEELAPLALDKRITLRAERADPSLVVLCDEDRILRVFFNLVGNALKFSPPGSEIVILTRRDGDAVAFDVRDQGKGVPEADLENLFDRYWKGDRADRRGTGLGLPIARGIVVAHGGRIGVESVEGNGTTVRFELPLAPSMAASAVERVAEAVGVRPTTVTATVARARG